MHLKKHDMSHIRCTVKRHFWGGLTAALALAGMLAMHRPAAAQLKPQVSIVLDFEVSPGDDPILGRKASDALAVELQRQNQFETVNDKKVEIVPRQRLDQIINEQHGLAAPYTQIVQSRLGQAAEATRVYSGRIMSVLVSDRRMARVTLEVRRLDVPIRAYINGAVASQEAVSVDGLMDNDLLIDQAINKAVYAALMEIKSKPLPLGTVQNVTVSEMYLNIGTRNGVLKGQRYVVIRPLYRGRDSESKDVVQSTPVAEVIVTSAEMDQASAVIISGGGAGVKTGDKVHLIYIPAVLPIENPDLRRTKSKYLTVDEVQALAAVEDSRRREQEAERRANDLKRAEERVRRLEKEARRNR